MIAKSKILVVDDKEENLLAMKQTLNEVDVEVITVTSGQEALKITLHHDFALIILDVQMPEMDGYELAELLRGKKKTQRIPIIFLSAIYSSSYSFIKGYKSGAVDFLTKPIEPQIIVNKAKVFVELDQQKKEGEKFLIAQQILINQLSHTKIELEEQKVELEKAKEEAESANKAKSQFLANMTHDIRTPLGAILGFNQILLEKCHDQDCPGGEETQKFHENIQTSAQNLLELLNNFLDISKIEAGKMGLSEENFNLKTMIQNIFDTHEFLARKKGVIITFDVSPKLPAIIRSDRTKLIQILTNLVGNAIKFTPEGKEVKLRVMDEEKIVTFMVIDEGIGIPEDRQHAVFGAFAQADNSTVRNYGGTGLGLAITKTLTEMLGGKVTLVSRGIGQGSNFSVRIPCKEASAPIVNQDDDDFKENRFSKDSIILMVEDCMMNQVLMEALLKILGLKVQFANDGKQGVDKTIQLVAENTPPDLIFMDMQMPVLGGIEATQEIRQNKGCKDIPIVGLSADAFLEQKKEAQAAGLNDYLAKPIDRVKLKTVLNKYLKLKKKKGDRFIFSKS